MVKDKWTKKDILVIAITFLMIVFWCLCGLIFYASCFYGCRMF